MFAASDLTLETVMFDGKFIFMRWPIVLSVLLSGAPILASAQLPDSLSGTWKTREGDTLLIYKIGKSYIIGTPEEGAYRPYKLNTSQDSLISGNTRYFLVGKGKRYLHDATGIVKRNGYLWRSGAPKGDMQIVRGGPESFFDFSTTAYYAGWRYDRSPRAGILFPFNRSFIRKRRLDSLEVEHYAGKKYIDGSLIEKQQQYIFFFDQFGNVIKLKITLTGQPPIVWHYDYADASRGILKSILIPGKTMLYDEDNWEVDAIGQKVIPQPFLHWSYSTDTGLPAKATARSWNGRPYVLFQYNATRQLIRATYLDKTSPSVVGFHVEFDYDAHGVLRRITDVVEYKGKKDY
jgi:hypothetical protein